MNNSNSKNRAVKLLIKLLMGWLLIVMLNALFINYAPDFCKQLVVLFTAASAIIYVYWVNRQLRFKY